MLNWRSNFASLHYGRCKHNSAIRSRRGWFWAGGRRGCLLASQGMPCLYGKMLLELAKETGPSAGLMDVVDIYTPAYRSGQADPTLVSARVECAMKMSILRLKGADPSPVKSFGLIRKALVVGGGVSGMTAALAIADHGFKVDLVEKEAALGGLVRGIDSTVDGVQTAGLVEKMVSDVQANANISVHTHARVVGSAPHEGLGFLTTIEFGEGGTKRLDHGVTILATGGKEAPTLEYCYGKSEAVVTMHQLEARLGKGGAAGARHGRHYPVRGLARGGQEATAAAFAVRLL